jgi:hypothetical protein
MRGRDRRLSRERREGGMEGRRCGLYHRDQSSQTLQQQ